MKKQKLTREQELAYDRYQFETTLAPSSGPAQWRRHLEKQIQSGPRRFSNALSKHNSNEE